MEWWKEWRREQVWYREPRDDLQYEYVIIADMLGVVAAPEWPPVLTSAPEHKGSVWEIKGPATSFMLTSVHCTRGV